MTTHCNLKDQSIGYEHEDDETVDPTQSSPQKRCELILNDVYKHRSFMPLDISNVKKTFCYLMQYHITIVYAYCHANNQMNNEIINMIYSFFVIEYFVKIYEDHQFKPIKIPKQLKRNPLKDELSNDLIIPLGADRISKPGLNISHKYDIVRYDFVHHVTLETIVLRTIQSKQLNSLYFQTKGSNPWIAFEYKLKMLHIFYRVIQIVVNMYHLQLIDLDTSPDNFIIKTANNGQWRWKEVTAGNCYKIDHESMITFKNGKIYAFETNKPMKSYCIPPEISAYIILNDPYKIINVERFSVYQIAATFIYILFGQCNINGSWNTLNVEADGVNHGALGWSPKLDLPQDLAFLNECMALSPSKRPTFQQLAKYVLHSIKITNDILLSMNNHLPRKVTKRPNNLYANYNTYINNGRVQIVHNPQSTQQNNNGEFAGYNQLEAHRYHYNGYGDTQRDNGYIQQQHGYINNQQQKPGYNQQQQYHADNDDNDNNDDNNDGSEDDEEAVNYD